MVNHMRHTRSQTGTRRSHHALTAAGVILCADCGQPKRKHVMCATCGKYKGKIVVDLVAKADKKAAKKKAVASR
ncbi:MAG: 50S ribosomal protein L32 [Patescibacteria group bacterium]